MNEMKFLIPMLNDIIIPRKPAETINTLLKIHSENSKLLRDNKWIVGVHEVTKLRIISDIII